MTPCPKCQFATDPAWFFCPNCGKQLKQAPLDTSLGKQLTIYLVSFFLSPLGLGWGLKYVANHDPKTRTIGVVAIALTIVAIGMTLTFFSLVMQQYAGILNNPGGYSYPGLQ